MKQYAVQVGKGKSAYRTRWTFEDLNQAMMWYNGINSWGGGKKRLVDRDTGKIIERYIS